jgi:PAS domain S-box-containing protein
MQKEKTHEQLMEELAEVRQRITELEELGAECRRVQKALRASEERFRTVADFTYDWEYWIGVDGEYLYVSPSCERITGYGPDEFQKNPDLLLEIVHPNEQSLISNHIGNESDHTEVLSSDFRIINRNGGERWIGHFCQPVYSPDGRYLGRRASNRDITEHKQATDAVRVSEERYRRLTQATTDYIFTVRVDNGRAAETVHGPGCEAVTGYNSEEFSSDPSLWIRMVPEDDRAVVVEQANRIIAGEDPYPIEHRMIKKDGAVRWVSNTPVPSYDVQDNLTAYEGLIRDITERKESEEALRESEERYRQLVETMNEGLAKADQDYTFTYVNERFCLMLGYPREEILGHHLMEFVHEDYRESMTDQMAMRKRGEAKSYEIAWRAKDDRTVHTLISPRGFYDASGRFAGSLGVLTDITERKRAEEALQKAHDELERRVQERTAELVQANELLLTEIDERKRVESALRDSEARYRLLIGNLPSIVYRGYKDWSVDFMDEKIELLTGYSKEEFDSRRKNWSDVVVGEDVAVARDAFIKALKTDKAFIREYRIKTTFGEILWIQDRGYIVCDETGAIDHVSGVFFDVTERKRLEKALVQKEKLNTLGAITAEVAHEIRNPLVSLGGFARRLQQKSPDLSECNIILHECQRLETILTRIRNYLKPVDIDTQECSVNDILANSVNLLSPETEKRRVECRLDMVPSLPTVHADPDILTQIFVNLILNGAEAMKEGETLDIRTFEKDGELHIEFRNQTSGPEVTDPELLFMPFAEGGESIGLPLCYRLLKDMGGLLSFSQEKGYTVFTVSLPKTGRPSPKSR